MVVSNLKAMVEVASGFTSSRVNSGMLMLAVSSDSISITAASEEGFCIIQGPGSFRVRTPFTTLYPAKQLNALVGALTAGDVSISTNRGRLVITDQNQFKATLNRNMSEFITPDYDPQNTLIRFSTYPPINHLAKSQDETTIAKLVSILPTGEVYAIDQAQSSIVNWGGITEAQSNEPIIVPRASIAKVKAMFDNYQFESVWMHEAGNAYVLAFDGNVSATIGLTKMNLEAPYPSIDQIHGTVEALEVAERFSVTQSQLAVELGKLKALSPETHSVALSIVDNNLQINLTETDKAGVAHVGLGEGSEGDGEFRTEVCLNRLIEHVKLCRSASVSITFRPREADGNHVCVVQGGNYMGYFMEVARDADPAQEPGDQDNEGAEDNSAES